MRRVRRIDVMREESVHFAPSFGLDSDIKGMALGAFSTCCTLFCEEAALSVANAVPAKRVQRHIDTL
jgi:hypothetical protein